MIFCREDIIFSKIPIFAKNLGKVKIILSSFEKPQFLNLVAGSFSLSYKRLAFTLWGLDIY